MSSTIQVRVEDELKVKSDKLFKDLGMDTTTAIRIFLTQALAVNGFPFEIKRVSVNPYDVMSEDELLERLEKSRDSADKGIYKDAKKVSQNIREKYGL
jgi:DNA-damage-inducible protein J